MKRKATYIKNNVVVDVVRSNSEVCLIIEMKVNGVNAYLFDFGTMKDLEPQKAPASGCGNRSFVPKRPLPIGIMDKYHLSREDIEAMEEFEDMEEFPDILPGELDEDLEELPKSMNVGPELIDVTAEDDDDLIDFDCIIDEDD